MDLKEPQDIIGSRLREIRNESGMTTSEYAEALGVSITTFFHWEKGVTGTLKTPIVKKFSQLWNINPLWLMDPDCTRKYNYNERENEYVRGIQNGLEKLSEESLKAVFIIVKALEKQDDGK